MEYSGYGPSSLHRDHGSSDEDVALSTNRIYKDKDIEDILRSKENHPQTINYGSGEYSDEDNSIKKNENSDDEIMEQKVELPLGWKDPKKSGKKRYADISKDLKNYNFPDMVKTKANELAIKLQLKPHKNKPKRQQIFFLITSAYAECKILCDDSRVAEELKLKQTDINQARAIYNQVRTGYLAPEVPNRIYNWICTHLADIGLNEALADDVDYLIKSILIKEKNLKNENPKVLGKSKKIKDNYPQDIALAAILYELEMRRIIDDKSSREQLITQLYRKPSLVNTLFSYIKKVDNNA